MAVSAQYSVTIRVELDARQEPLGKLTAAIAEAGGPAAGGRPGARRRAARASGCGSSRSTPRTGRTGSGSCGRSARPAAPGCSTTSTGRCRCTAAARSSVENKYPLKTRDDLSMAYTPGVARVCQDIARRPRQGLRVHDQEEHRRGRLRRQRRARARQHRPRGGDAGDGGQGDAVQGVRRGRRLPDLPRHPGRRGDRQGGRADRADLRRHQPRGHLRPALLRDRGAAEGLARHPGLPRRPARHRGGGDGGAVQRAEDRRQADRGACGCWSSGSAPPASR